MKIVIVSSWHTHTCKNTQTLTQNTRTQIHTHTLKCTHTHTRTKTHMNTHSYTQTHAFTNAGPGWLMDAKGTISSPYPPSIIVMPQFSQHKRNGCKWFSHPFYTQPGGYKLCLCVYANGAGSAKGKHISMSVYVMKGENDHQLQWPFEHDVTYRKPKVLLSQLFSAQNARGCMSSWTWQERIAELHIVVKNRYMTRLAGRNRSRLVNAFGFMFRL